jgi:hypothetical protein
MKRKSGQLRDLELDSESVERFRFPWDQGITTLYKYRSFQGESRDWVEQILLESKIYFSHADEFNDPFDVAPTLVHGGDVSDPAYLRLLKREELRSHLGRGMSRREIRDLRRAEGVPPEQLPRAALVHLRQSIRDHSRILCLSARRDHPLQWSHYSNGHKGLCIHFRCEARTWAGGARQVRYQRPRIPLRLPLTESEWDMVDKMVLTKASFWRYEEEYRVIALRDADQTISLRDQFLHFAPSDITGITIGAAMDQEDRRALFSILDRRRQQLEVWECVEDFDRFALKIHRISSH